MCAVYDIRQHLIDQLFRWQLLTFKSQCCANGRLAHEALQVLALVEMRGTSNNNTSSRVRGNGQGQGLARDIREVSRLLELVVGVPVDHTLINITTNITTINTTITSF